MAYTQWSFSLLLFISLLKRKVRSQVLDVNRIEVLLASFIDPKIQSSSPKFRVFVGMCSENECKTC